MPLRQLTEIERGRLKRLNAVSVEVTLIEPTRTGLEKSILDATAPVRNFLLDQDIHDFSQQLQGRKEHGVSLAAELMDEALARPSRASLYRPTTKKGDPRIWFSGLAGYARPNDMVAIAAHEGRLVLINLTRVDIDRVLDEIQRGALWEFIQQVKRDATSVSQELLALLRTLASRGPVPSVMEVRADTAIGRTIETAVGIPMNALRTPDYKGIELKSYRRAASSRENRKNLFARVPDWSISKFKSSAEILDAFGYYRDEDFKLYCTTSSQKPNAQGLFFKFSDTVGQLDERSSKKEIGAFASWLLDDLRSALLEKHNETFWIAAKSLVIAGREHFDLLDVRHTKKPILAQFDILLEQGDITMDHLIKRYVKGRVKEKGPLFKINTTALDMLFPPSESYPLK